MRSAKTTGGRRKTPTQERSRETVGFILEAAAQLFGERGYRATTTNHVAGRAGVSIGSVYQYFPNKEALLLALAEKHLIGARKEIVSVLRGMREREAQPEEYFRGFVQAVVDFHSDDEALHSLFFEEAPGGGTISDLVRSLNEALGDEVEAYLKSLVRDDRDLALESAVLVGMAGTLSHEMVLEPPEGQRAEDVADQLVLACLRYLGYAFP